MNYERLEHWLYGWERRLEEPKKLLLDPLFLNVVRLCLVELERRYLKKPDEQVQKSAKGYESEWLRLLEQRFDKEKETVAVLRADNAAAIDDLGRLLHAGAYHVGKIYPLLQDIKDAPTLDTIKLELQVELGSDADDDSRLQAVSKLLARKLLLKHHVRGLKKLLEASLARHGSEAILAKHVHALAGEEAIFADLLRAWQAIFEKEKVASRTGNLIRQPPSSLYDLFQRKRTKWRYLVRPVIQQVAELLAEGLGSKKQSNHGENDLCAALGKDHDALRTIGRRTLERYIPALVRQAVALLTSEAYERQESPYQEAGGRIGTWLTGMASFGDNREPRRAAGRPDVVDDLAAGGLAVATEHLLANIISTDPAVAEERDGLALDLGLRLAARLGEEARRQSFDWATASDQDLQTLCADFSARKDLHLELAEAFRPLGDRIFTLLAELTDGFVNDPAERWRQNSTSFWKAWVNSFSRQAFTTSHVLHYLPWATLDGNDLTGVVNGLCDTLLEPPSEWQIIFRVKGILPQGATWHAGAATFYDPGAFDFGKYVARAPSEEGGGAVVFARVSIVASAPEEAKQIALRSLNTTLDLLSFPLSVNESAGGLKPEVEYVDAVSPLDRSGWLPSFDDGRAHMPSDEPAVDGKLAEMSREIEPLLDLTQGQTVPPRPPTQLQTAFILGTHWYRRGRWETDHLERFIFYWIGLEQIFAPDKFAGDKKSPIVKDIPKFYLSWRNLPFTYPLKRMRLEMVGMIEGDAEVRGCVEAMPALAGWRYDHGQVFIQSQNIELLMSLIPEEKTGVKSYVKMFLEYVRGLEKDEGRIKEEVRALRAKYSFRLALLYDLRNRILHDALAYRADVEVCAEAVEEILEGVLIQISSFALSRTPAYNTWDQLATAADFPWPAQM